ncbi:MAG: hypothetical protein EXR63_05260 [Dehalococcoidia bacterium]|nr:hypothetical protein [Dehalococcoidia bacterium]
MTTSGSTAGTITVTAEIRIAARPETVFEFFVDPEKHAAAVGVASLAAAGRLAAVAASVAVLAALTANTGSKVGFAFVSGAGASRCRSASASCCRSPSPGWARCSRPCDPPV